MKIQNFLLLNIISNLYGTDNSNNNKIPNKKEIQEERQEKIKGLYLKTIEKKNKYTLYFSSKSPDNNKK